METGLQSVKCKNVKGKNKSGGKGLQLPLQKERIKDVESYDDEIIDDDGSILLFDFNTSKKSGIP